ncbi:MULTISPECIES: hypothetical protein [unclassified Agromyces]|uniref:hypothetical protein n=1 Tax=unclassified Agromyces TaxID=2639701 RepID=UPI0007B1F92A|nr:MULTISPECIES: hypothetical protein [unclassified Agromyces]KZE90346.1 hypothetical protein AVP42_02990 [Agromyces sp. NDB4Y10]MCK8610274.1 hypothetical protein [Agromyces sp. C10]
MGFLDRLFGGGDDRAARPAPAVPQAPYGHAASAPQRPRPSEDELAIERYRYLLRTAPPESIEAVHAEAFAKLTPEQRQEVYRALADSAPPGERVVSDEPSALARAATRAELRSPGTVERAFAGSSPGGQGARGPSFGSMLGASMLGTIAGFVVGSAIAQAFLPDPSFDQAGAEGDPGAGDAGAGDGGDVGSADAGGDWGGFGGGDFGGGDFGGDFGF